MSAPWNLVPAVRERVAQVVVGQDTVVERLLVALFTGGHLLLQGMPGLAKTLLVNTLARAIDLRFARVGGEFAAQQRQQAGLAGPVGARQAGFLCGVHGQRRAAEEHARAAHQGDITQGDHGPRSVAVRRR